MKIVIVGDGKMGYALSMQLSEEGHDVTIIDRDPHALEQSSNNQDVSCLAGDGLSLSVLREAQVEDCDMFIAVTSDDKTNILCCTIAKRIGAAHTVARVQDQGLMSTMTETRESLGIDLVCNPELESATEIRRILRLPSAARVDFFARGKVETVEIKLPDGCPIDGLSVSEVSARFKMNMLICAVQRGEEVFIPGGNFVLSSGDHVSITASPQTIVKFIGFVGIHTQKIKNVIIAGGGSGAYYLAQWMLDAGASVKIILPDASEAEALAEALPRAVVIKGSAINRELLHEERIDNADALVVMTDYDEENVVIAMHGMNSEVPKVITCINHAYFGAVLDRAGIDCVVTPNLIASNRIMSYARSIQNSLGSNVRALSRIADGKVEALEFYVSPGFSATAIPLAQLSLRRDLLLACIIREEKLIFPHGNDVILPYDSVIVIARAGDRVLNDLEDILLK